MLGATMACTSNNGGGRKRPPQPYTGKETKHQMSEKIIDLQKLEKQIKKIMLDYKKYPGLRFLGHTGQQDYRRERGYNRDSRISIHFMFLGYIDIKFNFRFSPNKDAVNSDKYPNNRWNNDYSTITYLNIENSESLNIDLEHTQLHCNDLGLSEIEDSVLIVIEETLSTVATNHHIMEMNRVEVLHKESRGFFPDIFIKHRSTIERDIDEEFENSAIMKNQLIDIDDSNIERLEKYMKVNKINWATKLIGAEEYSEEERGYKLPEWALQFKNDKLGKFVIRRCYSRLQLFRIGVKTVALKLRIKGENLIIPDDDKLVF